MASGCDGVCVMMCGCDDVCVCVMGRARCGCDVCVFVCSVV